MEAWYVFRPPESLIHADFHTSARAASTLMAISASIVPTAWWLMIGVPIVWTGGRCEKKKEMSNSTTQRVARDKGGTYRSTLGVHGGLLERPLCESDSCTSDKRSGDVEGAHGGHEATSRLAKHVLVG